MTATELVGAVIAAIRTVGIVVVDDLDGRPGRGPPDAAAAVALERPVDADGAQLADGRLQAELRVSVRVRLRRGQAWADMRLAEVLHELLLMLPSLALGESIGGPVVGLPQGRRLVDEAIRARVRLRLLTGDPQRGLQASADAVEALRAVGGAVMHPRPGVDEVILPSSLDLRAVSDGVGVLEADLELVLDPLDSRAFRTGHAAMVEALREVGRRVDDDGSGAVADLLEQRDRRAADLRLLSYAGWSLARSDDAVDASLVFPALF